MLLKSNCLTASCWTQTEFAGVPIIHPSASRKGLQPLERDSEPELKYAQVR